MTDPRMTLQTQLVLKAFTSDPTQQRYGLEICDLVGLASGTVYPILARLEQAGWLESGWEDGASVTDGRPRRRFYSLSADGAEQARDALARSHRSGRPQRAGWNVSGQTDPGVVPS
ncbi:PadR family transcriptional regulator [Catellatospora chokoriensis]|uniref:PadR family transcriptional regulator n=1 Tax=Catellatospora chokoriensis TaxID=310353 RepID=A0A8J3JSZ4_9ACTN|nr:PadR family transcriptional regulator [Catellatospora chokoriensis]GIF90516.1 PadR family transcriptional regulator [Catellatospora chokoriensis]